jgi:hypothetical protein
MRASQVFIDGVGTRSMGAAWVPKGGIRNHTLET